MKDLDELLISTNDIYKINTKLFGIEDQKKELLEFASYIFDSTNYDEKSIQFKKMMRLELNNNILLTGKPGVGKTRSVYWLVKELKKKYKNIDFYSLSIGSILNENLGASSKIIENYFTNFRELANNSTGTVVLLDELDWLGISRFKISETDGVRRALTSLLLELDKNITIPNFLFICSTNIIDFIDVALLRRFTKRINYPEIMELTSFENFLKYIHFDLKFTKSIVNDLYQIVIAKKLTPSNIKDAFRNAQVSPTSNDLFENLENHLMLIDSTIEHLNQSHEIFSKS